MKISPKIEVREFYEKSASGYSEMMDSEIGLPIYADVFGRLIRRVSDLPGPLVDTSWEHDIVAFRYRQEQLMNWASEAGFSVDRCVVEPVEGMPMDAIYLEASKAAN